MKTEREYFFILGLEPGASYDEIKAAYRRLVKRYHPDHDRSLDAEVKYKDVRAAYKALRNRRFTSKRSTGPATSRCSSEQTPHGWEAYVDLDDFVYGREGATEQVPFSLSDLPAIFWASLTGSRPFWAIYGSIPIFIAAGGILNAVSGILLIFAVCLLIAYIECRGLVEDNTACRMFFLFPFIISTFFFSPPVTPGVFPLGLSLWFFLWFFLGCGILLLLFAPGHILIRTDERHWM